MKQELADPKQSPREIKEVKKTTQQFKIQQIWIGLKKTEWNKETDEEVKTKLKGELYTKIAQIYEQQEGKPIKRSTIRRCVNSLFK